MRNNTLKTQVVEALEELISTTDYLELGNHPVKPTPHKPFLNKLKNDIESDCFINKSFLTCKIKSFLEIYQGPTTFFSKENIGQGRTYQALQSLLIAINNCKGTGKFFPGITEEMFMRRITHFCEFYGVKKEVLDAYLKTKNSFLNSISNQAEDSVPSP